MNKLILLIAAASLTLTSCSFRPIYRNTDVTFDDQHQLKMDIYSPKKGGSGEIMLFVHGGNWNSGTKKTYRFFGKGMAKKGIVTAVMDYRLAPGAGYNEMATDVANAVKYLKQNGSQYGGDTSKVFVSGHSAGGHLAALVATNDRYFKKAGLKDPIKGVVMIDAFGLDMNDYFNRKQFAGDTMYYATFTEDSVNWKDGSPINYLSEKTPPLKIFVGGWTFTSITRDNFQFWDKAKQFQPELKITTVPRKRHAAMIIMFVNAWNKNYGRITGFLHDPKAVEAVDVGL